MGLAFMPELIGSIASPMTAQSVRDNDCISFPIISPLEVLWPVLAVTLAQAGADAPSGDRGTGARAARSDHGQSRAGSAARDPRFMAQIPPTLHTSLTHGNVTLL